MDPVIVFRLFLLLQAAVAGAMFYKAAKLIITEYRRRRDGKKS